MTNDDRQMVNWFKAELKAYLSGAPVRKKLEEKIEELENHLAYHSPSLSSDSHGSPKTNDEKLALYVTKKANLEAQKELLDNQVRTVETILGLIPQKWKDMILRIHKGRATIEGEAVKAGRDKTSVQYEIDKEILIAMKRYIKGGY